MQDDMQSNMQSEFAQFKNDKLRTVLDAMHDCVYIVDRDGEIQYANPMMVKEFGLVQSRRCFEYLHSRVDPCPHCRLGEVQQGKTFIWEWRCHANGKTYELFDTPLLFEDGTVSKLEIFHDVTRQRQMEVEIRQRNHELLTLNEIGAAMSSSLELDRVLSILQQTLVGALNIPAGAIYLCRPGAEMLHLAASWGAPAVERDASPLPISAYRYRHVILEKRPVVDLLALQAAGEETAEDTAQDALECSLCIPLLVHDHVLGVLELHRCGPVHEIRERVKFFTSLGHTVGLAIYNANQYETELRLRKSAETLREASAALTATTLAVDAVANTVLDYLAHLIPYTGAGLLLLDFPMPFYERLPNEAFASSSLLIRSGDTFMQELVRKVLEAKRSSLISGGQGQYAGERLLIPFIAGGKAVAIGELVYADASVRYEERIHLVEVLAGQAAAAIENARLFEEVRAARERQQSFSRRLVEVQESERSFIARELHDEAGQQLTSLKLRLRLLERDEQLSEEARAGIGELQSGVERISKDLHQLARNLRPPSLDHVGLTAALAQLFDNFEAQTGTQVAYKTIGAPPSSLSSEIETALYRIVQEGLTNIIRHAGATRVDILLKYRERQVVGLIEDNGQGFDISVQETGDRLGILGMQERAEMLGGTLSIESTPGEGTIVFVEIPYG